MRLLPRISAKLSHQEVAAMTCPECEQHLDHCDETMVLHLDGEMQCIDPACKTPRELHFWEATCLELHWKCPCQRTGHVQPLAA
jgi:hypothetical protein